MPLTLTTLPVEIITEILRLVQHGPSLASVAQTCECLCSIAQNIIVCEVNLTSARQTEQFITTMYNNHSRMAYVRALRIKSSEASLFPSRTPEVTASLLQQLASIIKKTKGLQELVITSRDLSWSTHAINDALSTCNNLTKLELISKAMKDLPHSTLIALRNLSAPVEVLVIGRVNYQPIHIFQVIKNFTSTLKSLTLKSCIIRPLEDLNLKWPKVHSLFLDAVTLLDVSVETAFPNVRILRVERIQYLFLSLDDVRRFTRWKAVSFVRTDYLTMAGMDLGACKIKQFHLDANGTHLVRDRSQFDLERFLTGHNLEYLRVLFYWGTPEDFVMLQHLSDLCNMVCFLDLTATIYMTDKLSEHPVSHLSCAQCIFLTTSSDFIRYLLSPESIQPLAVLPLYLHVRAVWGRLPTPQG